MSVLPNAPLMEVIYELRWPIINNESEDAWAKVEYLSGDLYAALKHKFGIRQRIQRQDVPITLLANIPTHRFRQAENSYPLMQIGPGVITVNMDNDNYEWEAYYQLCQEVTGSFFTNFRKTNEKFQPSLCYIDFFDAKNIGDDIVAFINRYFQLKVDQIFLEPYRDAKHFELRAAYPHELGILELQFQPGNKNIGAATGPGLLLFTKLTSNVIDENDITSWLENAHHVLRKLFKDIIVPDFYESFKS